MYSWLNSVINLPSTANDTLISGAVLLTLMCVGFVMYLLSRLFK